MSNINLDLKTTQQLSITPQLKQAIRLLQLSQAELLVEAQAAIESNPLLEADEPEVLEHLVEDWQRTTSTGGDTMAWEQLESAPETLASHLQWQVEVSHFSPTEVLIAEAIIDSIKEDGYLEAAPDILYAGLETQAYSFEDFEHVRMQMMQLDPIGVGAATLQECLLAQANHFFITHPLYPGLKKIILSHLADVPQSDTAQLAAQCGLALEDCQAIIHLIQGLNPKPGLEIGAKEAEHVLPDVFVQKINDEWVVRLNNQAMPVLRITPNYGSLMQQAKSQADHDYIKQHLQEARFFLKSIENRNQTLINVARAIMTHQAGFLEHGEEAMKPLVLSHIAAQVDVHESTVSRVTTHKYIHTPRGLYELKYFFSSHVTSADGETSAIAIQALLKKLIASESPNKPFSDNKLAHLLSEQGIKIARRTVAKYREALHIPPSHERKQ